MVGTPDGVSLTFAIGPTPALVTASGLLAPSVATQLDSNARGLPGFHVAVTHERHAALAEELRRTPCDVLVLELEQLGEEPLRAMDECLVASEAGVALSFPMKLAMTFQGQTALAAWPDDPSVLRFGQTPVPALSEGFGAYRGVDAAGYFMGAMAIQEAALAAPDRFRRLVMVGAWARPDARRPDGRHEAQVHEAQRCPARRHVIGAEAAD